MTKPDCIIIGGGVVGLSIAWVLAKEGQRIQVVDRGEIGRGASWAAVGILPPANPQTALDPVERIRALSHELHPQWAAQLREATGIDNGYRACGGVYLATSRGEAASLTGLADYWSEYDIEALPLTGDQLAELEPSLKTVAQSKRLRSAWLLPGEAQIRSPYHLRSLRAACEQLSVVFTETTPITAIERDDRMIKRLRTDQGDLQAGKYVVASGAWSRALLETIEVSTGVYPVRGQVLLYRLPPSALSRVINEGNRYFVPRDDGHLLVGSNEEEVGFAGGTTPDVIASLQTWAEAMLPPLAELPIIKTWSGLRPASFDGFPYIGKLPGLENGYVATGHYRSGLHLSCATATLLASLMASEVPAIDLSHFAPGRG